MYSPNTIAKLNQIAHRYVPEFESAITEAVKSFSNTGAGAQSIEVSVVEGTAERSPEIIVKLDDHVMLFDSRKKLQWTKFPNMRKLREWAATKRSDEDEAQRLAWSVAWNQYRTDAWKKKPWRKKSLGKVLKELNQMLLQAFDAAINEDLQQAINRAQ